MQEIPYWQRTGTREQVLRTCTATEAADTGRWHSLQGDYRSAAVWHQLAGALEAADRPNPEIRWRGTDRDAAQLADQILAGRPRYCGVCGVEAGTAHINHGIGPTGNGDADLAATAVMRPVRPDDTASIPLPESHAPTTCVYAWDISTYGEPGREMVCGELIRWSEPNGWYHVNDKPLGKPSDHTATPQGLGPLPQRQGPLA
jgi:hypothetical protein